MNEDSMQDAVEAGDDTPPMDEAEALRAELEHLKAQSLIERADLDNQRKRMGRELDNARRFANERLLGDLLPVLDSLEAGLALTQRQLLRVAEINGLVTVAPVAGDAFDPDRHQAMSMIDAAGVAPGAIAQLFQKGYVLNERLLRPALVVVAKHD
jgi:molecular chaperone GrpE